MEPAPDIVDEDARADDPLAEEFSPRALAPAGIRDRQVEIVSVQVVPHARGDEVPERVGVVVDHHLRLAGGAGGEEDQQRVGRFGPVQPWEVHQFVRTGRGVVELDGVADPPVPRAVDHEPDPQCRALVPDLLDLIGMLGHGDDHPDVRCLDAVLQVFGRQHRRRRAVYGTEFDEGDDEDPPLRSPGEHQHDPVAFLDAVFYADVDRLVREAHEVEEGVFLLVSLLVGPDHGKPVPVLLRPCVDHVEAEIIVFRDVYLEIRAEVFVGHRFLFIIRHNVINKGLRAHDLKYSRI